jgi:beta-xylosidase
MKLPTRIAMLAAATAARAQDVSNPVLYEDLADLDIFRVNDTFYYSASTMHFSPGAPILRSYDLVSWEFIGHSVPQLSFGDKYDMAGNDVAYVNGIWASTMRYRESTGLWYWYGCIEFGQTQIFTASDVTGAWEQQSPISTCYYDAGLLIDDDDTMYIAYGNGDIRVAQLSEDGLTQVQDQSVFNDGTVLEGSRFYRINGVYYIWVTRPANGQFVLTADSPFGPYTKHTILDNMASPIPTSGVPHQGGIVDTPAGDWYYMSFLDAYPNGRMPALAPLTFDGSGIPQITTDNGAWGASYPAPIEGAPAVDSPAGPRTDSFDGDALNPQWEWNHNPDNEAWSLGADGLVLNTATVTDDLYHARNTLTHRILGPHSTGTFRLNLGGMADGDVAGVAVLRDSSAWIGVRKQGDSLSLEAVHGLEMAEGNGGWDTTSTGSTVATADGVDLSGVASGDADLWLRIDADVTPSFGSGSNNNPALLQYSLDGESFTDLGSAYALHNRWEFFMAFRYAVFNHATTSLGGSVVVKEFDMQLA